MKSLKKRLMVTAAGFMGGVFIVCLAACTVYYPLRYAWRIVNGRYDVKTASLMILIWVLVNLILYQLIGGTIAYVWHYKNRKNFVLHASREERKTLKRKFGVRTDEELDKMEDRPSLLAAFLLTSEGLTILRNFLVDGPHIAHLMGERNRTVDGIIKNRTFFDYAVMRGESENVRFFCLIFHPRYLRYFVMAGILGYLSITFWCLIPFTRAAVEHYRKLNDFVADFSPYAAICLKHSRNDADIDRIQKLHDMIWNESPHKDYFEKRV